MIHHGREMRLTERQHPHELADAAERANLRLGDIQPPRLQQTPPAPATELRLAARDGDGQPGAQLAVSVAVFRRDRFFEPSRAKLAQRAAHMKGVGGRVAVVCVNHEGKVVADAAPHRLRQLHIFARTQTDLHLGRREAHLADRRRLIGEPSDMICDAFALQHHAVAVDGHVFPMPPADHLRQRQPGDLAGDIPKRDVDAGQRLHRHALLPVIAGEVIDLVPDGVPVQRIVAFDHRRDDLLDDPLVGAGDVPRTKALAPPRHALIRAHLHQMGAAAGVILLRIAKLFRQIIEKDMADDFSDFHGRLGTLFRCVQLAHFFRSRLSHELRLANALLTSLSDLKDPKPLQRTINGIRRVRIAAAIFSACRDVSQYWGSRLWRYSGSIASFTIDRQISSARIRSTIENKASEFSSPRDNFPSRRRELTWSAKSASGR